MLYYLFFLHFFSKLTFAALSSPKDPYSGDRDKNYLYEQACHQSASEHSTRYENPIVQSKMFRTFYIECLTAIWPGCEVRSAKDLVRAHTTYDTFKAGDVITRGFDYEPSTMAHKSGFSAEKPLEPSDSWFIFWDPSEPKTDVEKFNKIKFASTKDLYNIHLKNIISGIKKFQNAGIEDFPDKLHVMKKCSNGKHRYLMDFKELKTIVASCVTRVEMSRLSHKLSRGNTKVIGNFLCERLPIGSIRIGLLSKRSPERVQLFHPLYTVIKPDFPMFVRYVPSGMKPISYPYHPRRCSFIAAVFDENGNFVKVSKKNIAACLVMAFDYVKPE